MPADQKHRAEGSQRFTEAGHQEPAVIPQPAQIDTTPKLEEQDGEGHVETTVQPFAVRGDQGCARQSRDDHADDRVGRDSGQAEMMTYPFAGQRGPENRQRDPQQGAESEWPVWEEKDGRFHYGYV